MKKLIVLFSILLAGVCYGFEQGEIHTIDGWLLGADGSNTGMHGYQLAADGSESFTLDMNRYRPSGFASLQIKASGSGTLRIYHTSSNDCVTYTTANGFSDIVTALTAGSEIYAFDLPFSRCMRVFFTETGGANSITIDNVTLAIQ